MGCYERGCAGFPAVWGSGGVVGCVEVSMRSRNAALTAAAAALVLFTATVRTPSLPTTRSPFASRLDRVEAGLRRISRSVQDVAEATSRPASPSPASSRPPSLFLSPPPPATALRDGEYYEGNFLLAHHEPLKAVGDAQRLLKSLLGLAFLLRRTLILPYALAPM